MLLTNEQKQMIAMACIVFMGVAAFWLARDFRPDEGHLPDPQIADVKEHVAKYFADPKAQVVEISEGVLWRDSLYRNVKIRHLNAMGGYIFTHLIAQFDGDVIWEATTFDKTFGDESSEDRMALARAIDSAEKIDVRGN